MAETDQTVPPRDVCGGPRDKSAPVIESTLLQSWPRHFVKNSARSLSMITLTVAPLGRPGISRPHNFLSRRFVDRCRLDPSLSPLRLFFNALVPMGDQLLLPCTVQGDSRDFPSYFSENKVGFSTDMRYVCGPEVRKIDK